MDLKKNVVSNTPGFTFLLIGAFLLGAAAFVIRQSGVDRRFIIREFNKIYYHSGVDESTSWLGVHSQQNPCDNWMMQQIITELKPDLIVESGTADGGTTLFYSTVLAQIHPTGKILTIDIEPNVAMASQFATFQQNVQVITGDSTSSRVVDLVRKQAKGRKVLVTLDSDHSKDHVMKELLLYAPIVSRGSYLVVQDTNVNGHPILPHFFGPGPYEAVQEFLKTHEDFIVDHDREKFLLTWYPSGYLKRVR